MRYQPNSHAKRFPVLLLFLASGLVASAQVQTLEYAIGWGVIPVARASISVNGGDSAMSIRTVGVARWLYPVDNQIKAQYDAEMRRSLRYRQVSTEGRGGRHKRDITTRFLWDDGTIECVTQDGPQKPIALKAHTVDPLSTLLYFRDYPLEANTVVLLPISDGRELNEYAIKIGEVEEVSTPAGTFPAYRLTPSTEHIGGAFKESANPTLHIWMTEEKPHTVIKIESEVRVGSFSAVLTSDIPHESVARQASASRRRR